MNESSPSELLKGLNHVEEKYAPATLYWSGRADLLRRHPRIAVIGTRQCSDEGQRLARAVAKEVVDMGGVVVSGLAMGIDRAAHEAAIASGGDTIAVIGTPLSRAYPRENADLQDRIARQHLLVSQFAEGQPTTRKSFILRNRTMALLSHGSVIVEAGAKSGTEHQGWEALRLGRELFLSRSLLEADFEWPAKMQEYGATVFDDAKALREILEERLPGSTATSVTGI